MNEKEALEILKEKKRIGITYCAEQIRYDTALEVIEKAITSQNNKHGKWISDKRGTYCSECGRYSFIKDGDRGFIVRNKLKPFLSDYCPFCGKDMRGV